jgi:hypothetical protein
MRRLARRITFVAIGGFDVASIPWHRAAGSEPAIRRRRDGDFT